MISHPSDRPISALQVRMIEDMSVRGFSEKTRSDYIRNVRALAAFIGRSPDTATAEDLRRFQLHQTQTGVQPPSINSSVAALRFFFTVTLNRPDLSRRVTIVREPRRLPAVLSVEEVTLLLQTAPGPKYEAAFATAYGAGLRVSEVVALKVGDVDSERMLLRVEQGKGRKDRHAMLSPQLLELLRAWWREGRRLGVLLPRGWLFPGRNPLEPLSATRRRLRRSRHRPPRSPPGQIPIVVNHQPGGARVPSWGAFGRRPLETRSNSRQGRHPNPFTIAAIAWSQTGVSVGSEAVVVDVSSLSALCRMRWSSRPLALLTRK
jgi:site-specific recombinase XerD